MAVVPINTAVRRASETPIVDAAARLSVPTWPFLPETSNVSARKALKFIERHYDKLVTKSVKLELTKYLALSASCHVLDGWRYLAEAALALLRGARDQALHLAYYAELRGAMSILAGSGIGILRNKHFAVEDTGEIVWIKNEPTHSAAWMGLREWARNATNARRVIEAIEVFGYSGLRWAEACRSAGNPEVIAHHWLENWSIDLTIFEKDRDARNEASYRPNLQANALNPLSRKELEIIRNISSACSRTTYGDFDDVDVALMHDFCLKTSELRFGSSDNLCLGMVFSEIYHWLVVNEDVPGTEALSMIKTIKTAPQTPSAYIIAAADKTKHEPVAVISRAFLLLRLAGYLKRRFWASTRRLAAGGTIHWHNTLLKDYSVHSHLFERGSAPPRLIDLDTDRSHAEEDLDAWLQQNRRRQFSGYRLWEEQSQTLMKLCQFERIGVLCVADKA